MVNLSEHIAGKLVLGDVVGPPTCDDLMESAGLIRRLKDSYPARSEVGGGFSRDAGLIHGG